MLVSWSYPPNQSYSDGRHRKTSVYTAHYGYPYGPDGSNVGSNNDNTSPYANPLGYFLSDYRENYGPAILSGSSRLRNPPAKRQNPRSRLYPYCGSPPGSLSGNGSRKAYVETPHTSYAYRRNHALLKNNLDRIRTPRSYYRRFPYRPALSITSRYYRRS